MKWFKAAKPLLTWREPMLFAARTRDRRGWVLRGLLALVIFAAMVVAFSFTKPGARAPKFSTAGAVTLSAVIGLFLTALLDAPDLNREATIYEDRITSFGNAGERVSMSNWPLAGVLWIRLVPPEELVRPFGAMEIATGRGVARVGVPARVSMPRIAEILHARGVAVTLAGWRPEGPADGPLPDDDVVEAASGPAALPAASARVERLGETEAGRIVTPFRYRLGLAMALGPLAVTLPAGLGLAGYEVYRLAILRAPASAADLAALGGGVALFVFGLWFTGRFANLAPMLYLRAAARSVIEMRPEAPFNPRDPEVVFIDVIPRANWGKVMLKEFSDTGLLKVDAASRSILFEGDKERWRIPAASLVSAEVESYRAPGSVEGQEGAETFFVTTIRANVGGEVWEAPMSKCHVEFRPKNNRLRESNAVAVRDRIRALQPSALRAAGRP